ncbi:alpha/beta fold hydrolase [Parapedomonas caeni]
MADTVNSDFLLCAGRRLHVRLWHRTGTRTVVIWHGVTGTCRDHDALAAHIAGRGWRVIVPDALGCGLSDWAQDADHDHSLTSYADMARDLLRQLDAPVVDWIGTSKGGGLGIVLAGAPDSPIRRMVLNDVGPTLPASFCTAIAKRLADPPTFDSYADFRSHLARFIERGGGLVDDAMLDHLTLVWGRRSDDGRVTYHHDRALAGQFLHHPEDFALWPQWDAMTCPVLLLRGELSPVLSAAEAEEMTRRGPRTTLVTLAGQGHVNFLDHPEHWQAINAFLDN